MKLAKRFLALALVAVMLVSTCVFANAATATVTMTSTGSKTLSNSVKYTTYDMTGSVAGGSSNAYVLEFNPKNGAIPMAYSGAGGANLIYFNTHINGNSTGVKGAKGEGYKVIGAINGSFFNANYFSMIGMLISGGRIIASDAMVRGESVGIFDINGNFTKASTSIKYTVVANGQTVTNGLTAINKDYAYIIEKKVPQYADMANAKYGVFYYDDYALSKVKENISGYEILCNKLDNGELAVNKTLKGEVVSVKSSTYGASRPNNDDQFYLFIAADSPDAAKFSGLTAGKTIEITATEQNNSAKTAMTNAYSVISSVYALVSNGVDQTNNSANIGTHSVTWERAWTAFGIKADGSYVYFINEEQPNGLTLKDVAAAMMKLGCVDVYRLDGGGSSAMYNEKDGVVYLAENAASGGRALCDVLLIVEKPEDTSTPDTPSTDNKNLAKDKKYTVSKSDGTTANGATKDWNANLTDEIAFDKCNETDIWANGGFSTWFGLHSTNISSDNYAYITLDLGAKYDISGIRIHCGNCDGLGIGQPLELYAQYSADGVNYQSVTVGTSDKETYWTGINVNANARYIRFKVYLNGHWAFFNEIKVYAKGATIAEPIIKVETPDNPEDPTNPGDVMLGDVNNNGKIDGDDYIILKRIFFGNAKLETLDDSANALARCDVNNSGDIDADDYIQVKRAYFGTAKLG